MKSGIEKKIQVDNFALYALFSCIFVLKDILYHNPKITCNTEGKSKRRHIFPRLEGYDGLAGDADTPCKLSDCPLESATAFDMSTMETQNILELISKCVQRQTQEPSTSRSPPGKASPVFVPGRRQPEPWASRAAQAGAFICPLRYCFRKSSAKTV